MFRSAASLAALSLFAAGCASTGHAAPAEHQGMAHKGGAHAMLAASDGSSRGMVHLSQKKDGIEVHVMAKGLPPGTHGIHIHAVGLCEGPEFKTAGGHWNPAGKAHGTENPQGAHAGDMPNITIGADGSGMLMFKVPGATLESLMDADGAAIVVHATADDYRTDPSGNSGARIACGVVAPMTP